MRFVPLCLCGFLLVALPALPVVGQERWEDPTVFQINREAPRATFIPYATEAGALGGDDEGSPYVLSLNGPWRFSWARRPADAPEGFFEPGFDDEAWANLPVPSNWELEGFGVPLYREAGVLPGPPGFVDHEHNPVGSYRRWFELPEEWEDSRVILHMGSVGSATTVWVNGREVGYSQGSKVPTEFDVTDFVQVGRNLLAVRVWRWSDGSYLEDVDFWRLSGIERDVYLMATPQLHVRDFMVTTTLAPDYRSAEIVIDLDLENHGRAGESSTVAFKLLDPEGIQVVEGEGGIEFRLEAPQRCDSKTPLRRLVSGRRRRPTSTTSC